MTTRPWEVPGFSFQLAPAWPPMFVARLPDMMRESAATAQRSAASTAVRRALLDSEDAEDRRRGMHSLFGMSRAGDERITKERS